MTEPRLVEPVAGPLDAVVRPPGSKSLTNRALLCAGLAAGTSRLHGVLVADDTEAMIDCLLALDASVTVSGTGAATTATIDGVAGHLPDSAITLDARLSGTTSRFVLAVLALADGPARLTGAAPLRARPMADGLAALSALGIEVHAYETPGHLPVLVRGGRPGASVTVAGDVSSQFLSGLLLAAPCFPDGLTVRVDGPLVSVPYVDLTVGVMRQFGASVERRDADWVVAPTGYQAQDLTIEPDASAASYFFAAAAIVGGRVRVEGLDRSSAQGDLAFVDVLERMGASVTWHEGAVEVVGTGTLHGVTADLADLSDTAQTLAAVAVFADGPTEVTGIGFIRRKETDRIGAVVTELNRLGVRARATADGFVIEPGHPQPGVVKTYDDHRMAMSFALLGLRAPGIRIADPDCVAKTFPTYFTELDRLRSGRSGTG